MIDGVTDEMKQAEFVGLPACTTGMEACVVDVYGDSAISVRLREIGMVPGKRVRVIRRGSPMIVEVGNSKYCLRGHEASLVTVHPREPVKAATEILSAQGAASN